MAQTTTYITLDVSIQSRIQVVMAKQRDTDSRFLCINMTDNGRPITIPDTCNVVINASRSDLESKTFAGVVSNGSLVVPITNWMMELPGKVMCDASVIDGGERLSTLNFIVAVEKSNADDNGGVDVDDENYDVLVSLISDVQDLYANYHPVHLRYSAHPDGTEYTETWSDGQYYLGISTDPIAPDDKSGYTWCGFIDPNKTYTGTYEVATVEDVKTYLDI